MAKMPAHRRQQHHHDESNNASLTTSNEGDDASSTMVESRLHINNSDNAIMTRAAIAIATTETPAH